MLNVNFDFFRKNKKAKLALKKSVIFLTSVALVGSLTACQKNEEVKEREHEAIDTFISEVVSDDDLAVFKKYNYSEIKDFLTQEILNKNSFAVLDNDIYQSINGSIESGNIDFEAIQLLNTTYFYKNAENIYDHLGSLALSCQSDEVKVSYCASSQNEAKLYVDYFVNENKVVLVKKDRTDKKILDKKEYIIIADKSKEMVKQLIKLYDMQLNYEDTLNNIEEIVNCSYEEDRSIENNNNPISDEIDYRANPFKLATQIIGCDEDIQNEKRVEEILKETNIQNKQLKEVAPYIIDKMLTIDNLKQTNNPIFFDENNNYWLSITSLDDLNEHIDALQFLGPSNNFPVKFLQISNTTDDNENYYTLKLLYYYGDWYKVFYYYPEKAELIYNSSEFETSKKYGVSQNIENQLMITLAEAYKNKVDYRDVEKFVNDNLQERENHTLSR